VERGWLHFGPAAETLSAGPFPLRGNLVEEGRICPDFQRALEAGAITLGIVVVGSLYINLSI
jgi:hypothetical protein